MLFSVHVFENNPSLRLIFVRSERLGMFRRATAFLCGENVSRASLKAVRIRGKRGSKKGRNNPAGKGGNGLPRRDGNGPEAYGHKKSPEAETLQGSW